MIQGQWFYPGKDISSLLPVRLSVFGRGADDLDGESLEVVIDDCICRYFKDVEEDED